MSLVNGKTAPADEDELRAQQKTAEEAWVKIGELPAAERRQAADAWAAEHGHLFYWCCGSPVFGGAESEESYVQSSVRGELHSDRVWW